MKKIVLALAVLFSVAMVSCSGNKAAENADSDTMVEESVAVEEVVVEDSLGDTTAAVAETAAVADEAPATK